MQDPHFLAHLRGTLDLHIHSDPDCMPRSLDGLEVAAMAKECGMKAVVLKNHFEQTASLAYLARKRVPGIEVFGGVALNLPVGGINPEVIEYMSKVNGGWGRIVWMPTFDAENHVHQHGGGRAFVPVSRKGQLLPEVMEVLKIIAKKKLVLATGHSSPAEALLLIRHARELGIETIVATHVHADPVYMNEAEAMEAASLGAFIEFTCLELTGSRLAPSVADHAKAIRILGVERCFLASDLGQGINPPAPHGFAAFIQKLADEGFTTAELDILTKRNPAKIIGCSQ